MKLSHKDWMRVIESLREASGTRYKLAGATEDPTAKIECREEGEKLRRLAERIEQEER